MKYRNLTLGQIEALVNIVGGEAVVRQLLSGQSKLTIKTIRRLTTLTPVKVVAEDNPLEFFKTQSGLYIFDSFQELLLHNLIEKQIDAVDSTIAYVDLAQPANDAEIGTEMPAEYVFEDVYFFLCYLKALLKKQWGGKEGDLLSNGYSNIFYVKVGGESLAVDVSWDAGDRRWGCHARRLVGLRWTAGSRVFSATAA